MARIRTIFARAVRRANVSLKRLPEDRGCMVASNGSLSFTCPYCSKTLDSLSSRERHIILQPYCRARRERELNGYVSAHMKKKKLRKAHTDTVMDDGAPPAPKRSRDEFMGEEEGRGDEREDDRPPAKRLRDATGFDATPHPLEASTEPPSSIQSFPVLGAGAPISDETQAMLSKEDLRDYLASCGRMGDPKKFEIAELMMTTKLDNEGRTRHLKSNLTEGKDLWRDSRTLLEDIDRLPYGPKWIEQDIAIGEGTHRRTHILFRRDIIEVIQDLIGDERFKEFMKYAPERHWSTSARKTRVYGEMWSGNWWWRMQYLIRDSNGTIVPLIIASDKTMLSIMAGGQQAYPVYLTIGNISKAIRRKASKRATVILGYLPVDSFKDVPGKTMRTKLRGELLHRAMEAIVEPLKTASREGVPMWCADGRLRRVYPILAAFVGDWPEQNDVSCTVRSGCPICRQTYHGRGSGKTNVRRRNQKDTVDAFRAYAKSNKKTELKELNLKPWIPFWADLPHVDFPSCITPDLLHQFHKGVFKSYVAEWVEEIIGEAALNDRFMAMPQAKDLRHFKNGITNVQQWTGRETKEMAKQFLPIIADDPAVPDDFVTMVRALLDFLYLAESAELAENEVTEMDEALQKFHSLKKVLVELELMIDVDKFDEIPKFHMLGHYSHSIRELGTPDGYNTESPEHLHIIYAKNPWRASNRREAARQIVKYVQRLEAIRIHRAYLEEYFGESPRRLKLETNGNSGDVYDEDESEGGDSDEDVDEEETTEVEVIDESAAGAYPQPTLAMAVRPTCPRLTGYDLTSTYGTTDIVRLVGRFLKPFARGAFPKPVVLLSDTFDVWHKLTLNHQSIPFAPNEPLHRDVIRIRPPTTDQLRRQLPGLFDTVLFLDQPQAVGLKRYRAGRVRAIFRLPPRLHNLYSGRLAYIELFTRFEPLDPSVHRMPAISHDLKNGQRQAIVVPVEDLVMACHLGPWFSSINANTQLHSRVDTHLLCRHFFLNPFYNSFSFLHLQHWQRLLATQAA